MNSFSSLITAPVCLLLVCAFGCLPSSQPASVVVTADNLAPAKPGATQLVNQPAASETPSCCVTCNETEKTSLSCCSEAEGFDAEQDPLFVSEWLSPSDRKQRLPKGLRFTDHRGVEHQTEDFEGLPLAISFVYTRCENSRKCPLVAATMVKLWHAAESEGIADQLNVGVITYDVEYDTPPRLKEFGQRHGMSAEDGLLFLRPDKASAERLLHDLGIAVSYDPKKRVNIHGNELLLFDREGRFVRRYSIVLWDNSHVIDDLQRLIAEPADEHAVN